MKLIIPYNSLIWGLSSLLVGLLLLINKDNAISFTIMILGILLVVTGGIQLIIQLTQNRKTETKRLPLGSILIAIFGIVLLIHPSLWSDLFMIVLGVIMVFLALNHIVSCRKLSKGGITIPPFFYIFSTLLLVAGVITLFNPSSMASILVFFVAIWLILYGIIEMVGYFMFRPTGNDKNDDNKIIIEK